MSENTKPKLAFNKQVIQRLDPGKLSRLKREDEIGLTDGTSGSAACGISYGTFLLTTLGCILSCAITDSQA